LYLCFVSVIINLYSDCLFEFMCLVVKNIVSDIFHLFEVTQG
jgi:hypothetical protein